MTFLPALLLAAIAGLNQPVSAAVPGAETDSQKHAASPALRSPGDAQIERTLKAKLAKSKLAADHFTFSVSKGVATIEGSTNVMQHKGVMTRMAKSSGATSVVNNIRISDAAKAKATAGLAKGRAASQGSAVSPTRNPPPDADSAEPPPIPRARVLPSSNSR